MSVLQEAIAEAVKDAMEPLESKIKELEKTVQKLEDAGDVVTTKELDKEVARAIGEKFENELPPLISQALIQMLATPPKKNRRAASDSPASVPAGDCPRQPHAGKCPSKWCLKAMKSA